MRRSIIAILISVNLTKHSLAFSPTGSSGLSLKVTTTTVSNYNARKDAVVTLHMTEEKKLSATDILARARKAVNRSDNVEDDENEDESAILFDDVLMDDMKYCLVALEKRVKEGPGSLTVQEIQGISDASARIVKDMNGNKVIEQKSSSSSATTPVPPRSTDSLSTVVVADSFNDDTAVVTPVADIPAPADTVASSSDPGDEREYVETSEEDGAQYDGKGGLGLAKETRNTYIIPGMDEMSPEEYQKALQESVSNRQKVRHNKRDGIVGNRAALQYLDQLNWGGASSNWKTE